MLNKYVLFLISISTFLTLAYIVFLLNRLGFGSLKILYITKPIYLVNLLPFFSLLIKFTLGSLYYFLKNYSV